jgi:hypothetical protein
VGTPIQAAPDKQQNRLNTAKDAAVTHYGQRLIKPTQAQKQKGLHLCNPLICMVGGARFELATNGLKVRCSTS